MKTSSAKSKGRRLSARAKEMLLAAAPTLEDGDIVVTSSGETGPDLKLSPAAQQVYPLKFEMKNQQALNIWASLEQAESHEGNGYPFLVFSRNHAPTYCAMKLSDLLSLLLHRDKLGMEAYRKAVMAPHELIEAKKVWE